MILATGSSQSVVLEHPNKDMLSSKNDGLKALNDVRGTLSAAKSILIVGGGFVGSEIAGELSVAYPQSKITIVHSGIVNILLND